MPTARVATDVVADDVVDRYRAGVRRLEQLVRQGLERGLDADRIATGEQRVGDATQAYRERQLRAARTILAELEAGASRVAPVLVGRAYRSAIVAVDRTAFAAEGGVSAGAGGRFGGVHQTAILELAGNLGRSLERAAGNARTNVETVFARAAELDGPLPARGVAGVGFIGRRSGDAWRRVALEQLAEGQVALETRRQISRRLVAELVDQGVTDALTGFVDSAGRRWSLANYAEMVTRTTTREATSRATVNRLTEGGKDLVTISSHDHALDECTPYDGQTFSLSGDDTRYPELDDLPPFHPNCAHVVTPADVNLDDFQNELEQAGAEAAGPEPAAPPPPPGADEFDPPPLSPEARPSHGPHTAARHDAEEQAYAFGDPGPELGADAARMAALEAEDAGRIAGDATAARRAVRAANKQQRAELAAIDEALGPDLVAALDDFKAAGVRWAGDRDLREALLAGETTIDDVTELAERELAGLEGRRLERERLKAQDGMRKGSIPCFVCGRRKRRPSDVCPHCGDDPTTYGGTGHELDAAYGYDPLDANPLAGSLGVRGRGILIQ